MKRLKTKERQKKNKLPEDIKDGIDVYINAEHTRNS